VWNEEREGGGERGKRGCGLTDVGEYKYLFGPRPHFVPREKNKKRQATQGMYALATGISATSNTHHLSGN